LNDVVQPARVRRAVVVSVLGLVAAAGSIAVAPAAAHASGGP
jgi:hypothetical protein